MRSIVGHRLVVVLLLGVAQGCVDAGWPVSPRAILPAPAVPPAPLSEPLLLDAGPALFVALPTDSLTLRGWAQNVPTPPSGVSWTMVSGAGPVRMMGAASYAPVVTGLQRGTYEFEMAVSAGGRVIRDTLTVHAIDGALVRDAVFLGKSWNCPMGCSIDVHDFWRRVPEGAILRVLIRPSSETSWVEVRAVHGDRFVYSVSRRGLTVFADDESGYSDVRVLWVVL